MLALIHFSDTFYVVGPMRAYGGGGGVKSRTAKYV